MNEESMKQLLRAFLNGANPDSAHSGLWHDENTGWLHGTDITPLSDSQEMEEINKFVTWYIENVESERMKQLRAQIDAVVLE